MDSIISLILSLNSDSPLKRHNAILEWLVLNPTVLTLEQQTLIMKTFKDASDKKVDQGKRDIAKRYNKKVREPGLWIFKESSDYGNMCQACSNKYLIGDPIWILNRRGWHLVCAPAEATNSKNAFYEAYLVKNQK